ncbi:MAG: DUF429 domain-containing protein [Fusobacteriota bacterium]
MKFIGIDLAWTYKNETGLCIMNEDGTIEYLDSKVYSDLDIISIISNYKKDNKDDIAIGVDAPLIVKNQGGSREAERSVMKTKINGFKLSIFVVSRGFLERNFGMIRGEILMNKIQKKFPEVKIDDIPKKNKSSIIETFPTGICCGIFPEIYPIKYKLNRKISYENTKIELKKLLKKFYELEEKNMIMKLKNNLKFEETNITKKKYKHIEDKVDAFLTAYGIFSIYKGYSKKKIFGEVDEGAITIPIKI